MTAANLGTAYELAGDNPKALEWIKEGVRRNGDSHYGTEWLHVKILEAKLALERDPHWLLKNSVLGANPRAPGDVSVPERPITDHLGRPKSLAEVEAALGYDPGYVKSRLAAQTGPAAATPPASNAYTRPYLLFASLACAALLLAGGLYAIIRRQRVRRGRT